RAAGPCYRSTPADTSRVVAPRGPWLRRHSQVVRQRIANPLFPGSNPGAASMPSGRNTSLQFRVHGLDCAEEVAVLRRALSALPGVGELTFDILDQRLQVDLDGAQLDAAALQAAIDATGMRAEPLRADDAARPEAAPAPSAHAWSAALSGGLLLAGMLLHA